MLDDVFDKHWEEEWLPEATELGLNWEQIEALKVLAQASFEKGVRDGLAKREIQHG